MYGANPLSPSKCCLARASGVGQILNRLGTILDYPPSSRQSHAWVDLLRMLQSSSYAAFKLTTLLSCSMTCTTQHHNVLHVIVIHNCDYRSSSSHPCGYRFHLQQSSCIYVDDGTERRWFLILFGVMSDVTVNKAVGYQMYDDVDDSYITYDSINLF